MDLLLAVLIINAPNPLGPVSRTLLSRCERQVCWPPCDFVKMLYVHKVELWKATP